MGRSIETWITVIASAITGFIGLGGVHFVLTAPQFSPLEVGAYLFSLGMIVWGCLVYLVARLGRIAGENRHQKAPLEELRSFFTRHAPTSATLIPSYKEEIEVIAQTILSAALQEYPNKEIVLLIDNSPNPTDPEDQELLAKTRALPGSLLEMLREPQEIVARGVIAHQTHLAIAAWFDKMGELFERKSHVDQTFIHETFEKRALIHRQRALELQEGSGFDPQEEWQWLRGLFRVNIKSFERKLDPTLSHAPNKAMNLNSYIAVMPEVDYLITLDADSVLSHDYASRMMYEMERKGSERLAVIHSPFKAYPGAPRLLERIAGATTDIGYYMHQGFTYFGASYWVGANAVVRKKALEEIMEIHIEGEKTIKKYIQDRTLIEDTESTIDFVYKGWNIASYPAQLSYSATPPDFGSLLIQRRRWANGGLLILPKLLRYLLRPNFTLKKLVEAFFRIHYLFSVTGMLLVFLFFFLFPVGTELLFLLLLAIAIPQMLLVCWDMRKMGHRFPEFFGMMGFVQVLVPVHCAGVVKSLQQAVTGIQIPFQRTPKIANRIGVPGIYVIAIYLFASLSIWATLSNALELNWIRAFLHAILALPIVYISVVFLGVRNAYADIKLTFKNLGSRL